MRDIKKKMVEYIDAKLKTNGLAQDAIAKKDARTLFRLAAQACVGIREVGGNNKGPMVEQIQQTIGGAGREAWCMAFVQTCLAYAELKTGVKSKIADTEHCMTAWKKSTPAMRVKRFPAPGAIAIFNYPPGANGHTGIVEQYRPSAKEMNLVEGNTESGLTKAGTIERDGGGVYYTKRSTVSGKKMKLMGFLIPF